jgi:hypothetical protein
MLVYFDSAGLKFVKEKSNIIKPSPYITYQPNAHNHVYE